MCGIFAAISRNAPIHCSREILRTLEARGPDSLQSHSRRIDVDDGSVRYLAFTSSVLSLRGSTVQVQPLIDDSTGSVLCWNGEAWAYDQSPVQGNDSQFIFTQLLGALAPSNSGGANAAVRSDIILKILTSISGPYAIVFYDAPTDTLYYARDALGRRSLIIDQAHVEQSNSTSITEVTISSFDVTDTGSGTEVPADGVHYLKLTRPDLIIGQVSLPKSGPSINRSVKFADALSDTPTSISVSALSLQLTNSVRIRVSDIPTCSPGSATTANPSRVAILFSGGIDCALLARLSHDCLPLSEPIDLLNVAFENPRTIQAAAAANKTTNLPGPSPYELCPDRVTGRSSFAELCHTCPNRLWRFVAINVPYNEFVNHRSTIIQLMRPHNTEMDLSIASALYFASRGFGTAVAQDFSRSQGYTTTARVLLSGLGADELFGGYSRHAAAFSRGGFDELNNELDLDFQRIGSRNLGRDDRVMAHWSREVRYPFLDEGFVSFALGLPAYEKVGFRPGKQIAKHFDENRHRDADIIEDLDPAKMILRCLLWNLGMKKTATERKRAIQFGARTAKMEGGRTKGTDVLKVA